MQSEALNDMSSDSLSWHVMWQINTNNYSKPHHLNIFTWHVGMYFTTSSDGIMTGFPAFSFICIHPRLMRSGLVILRMLGVGGWGDQK